MFTILLRFWKPLAGLVVILLVWALLAHREHAAFQSGYTKAVGENQKALDAWKLKYDAQVKDDEDRIRKAQTDYTIELAKLNALRAEPLPHLVCHNASRPRDVPATARLPDAQSAGPGLLPPEDAEGADFDPVPAAIEVADEADDLLAGCRQLHQAVHGIPSTQLARAPQ